MELCSLSSVLLAIAILFIVFYVYYTWTFSIFEQLGIPGPTPRPVFGNMHQLGPGMRNVDIEWSKKYGKLFGTFEGRQPMMVTADPEICKQICVKQFASFYNRRLIPLTNKEFLTSINMLKDQKWKNKRNALTPAFSTSKMKAMTPLVNTAADALVRNLEKHCESGKPMQCKDVFGSYAIDSLASAGFGVDVNSQEDPDNPFVRNAKEAFSFGVTHPIFIVIFFFPFLVPFFEFFDIEINPKRLMKYFLDLINETVALRKSQDPSVKRVDLLQQMMDAHDVYDQYIKGNEDEEEEDENGVKLVKDGKSDTHEFSKKFTNEDILGQSLIFFLGGFETTSTTMCFLAYVMATQPEIQDKVCKEIDDVMAEYDEPNYQAVAKMPYLDMVVRETLRMYPPAVRFDRECTEDITIEGYRIPKGMHISVAVYAIHHNPDIYPEPEKFIPERFTKEEKEKRHPYSWLPFGAGPRNCIGMRFALLELKIGLVRVFTEYKFEPCAETEIPPKLGNSAFLAPPTGITLAVKRRR
ncbi:cytochrome P450 3A24-like [Ptychodera flava]|uniref:cytochrome P450 3A24-like n=1 Tax=Ptychodera flava TaxID=63121 RepID=UPI00396A5C67